LSNDSAFPKLRAFGARLVFPMKVLEDMSGEEYRQASTLDAKICSLRQGNDLGNGNLRSIFARLQLAPTTEIRKRRGLIECPFECRTSVAVYVGLFPRCYSF